MLASCTIAKLATPAIECNRLQTILFRSCVTSVPSKCWPRSLEESSAAALTAQRSSLLSRQLICASALRPFYSCATRPALVFPQESQRIRKESLLRLTVKPHRIKKKKKENDSTKLIIMKKNISDTFKASQTSENNLKRMIFLNYCKTPPVLQNITRSERIPDEYF